MPNPEVQDETVCVVCGDRSPYGNFTAVGIQYDGPPAGPFQVPQPCWRPICKDCEATNTQDPDEEKRSKRIQRALAQMDSDKYHEIKRRAFLLWKNLACSQYKSYAANRSPGWAESPVPPALEGGQDDAAEGANDGKEHGNSYGDGDSLDLGSNCDAESVQSHYSDDDDGNQVEHVGILYATTGRAPPRCGEGCRTRRHGRAYEEY